MNPPAPPNTPPRPRATGKFISVGDTKIYLRGVTYGPFRPDPTGGEYADRATVERDFAAMTAAGINALRTYTVPPRWLLDCARHHDLWVLVGLAWEQRNAFLHDPKFVREIFQTVRAGVRACAGHPALLGFALANEIPAPVVRWHGHQRIERFLKKLYHAAKAEDPGALVTYVNYPSTEYLELPFVDLCCFNVYLETPEQLAPYLARLQNLAGDKPLLLAELGLDSRRNGEAQQAATLDWQIRLAFAAGGAGVFVFSWTDEWHRDGQAIADWDFGLTRRDRSAKPALAAVARAFAEVPFPSDHPWPRISVIVCTHKGAATLAECLAGVARLDYPDYETIVVNDGNDAEVAAVVEAFSPSPPRSGGEGRGEVVPFSQIPSPSPSPRTRGEGIIPEHRRPGFSARVLNLPHAGLSAARNAGCAAATGEIIAYLDDDAWPDPHWLRYLAHTFATTDCAAVGGPNIPPPTRRAIGTCVAHAPGGPIHVLLTDREAEHIPGCNMAFRKSALLALGGFDPQFRTAGDDVDICWRFTDCGLKIGFHPGAMVWHHRRQTIRAYLKQQSGYGRAEALLERKWPGKYNAAGQPAWHGRIYGLGRLSVLSFGRSRIYHGTWGSALFQSLYEPAPSAIWSLARMPEWFLVIFLLAALLLLSTFWPPLRYVWPLLVLATGIPVVQALLTARRAPIQRQSWSGLIALLHLLQPLARLRGRMASGLTPWRPRRLRGFALPGWRTVEIGSGHWRSPNDWLHALEAPLAAEGAGVFRGGDFDSWDLEVRGGALGPVRLRVLVEDYRTQGQLVRVRVWPRWPLPALLLCGTTALLALGAARDHVLPAALLFGGVALGLFLTTVAEWTGAMAAVLRVLRGLRGR